MAATKSLPPRPSLESLRKQAKKLARDVAGGNAEALARARTHLPDAVPPLTQRNAQFVIAREYGYAGWQDLIAEVSTRLGNDLDWAAAQAQRAIHDNDVDRLKQLLAAYPALLSWKGDDGDGLLGAATSSFGDSFESSREEHYTRAACAELLIDAGAVATPSICESLIESRTRGLLKLFQRKALLPRTLRFVAALGDVGAVRTALDAGANDSSVVNDAFMCACRFEHEAVASLLLERAIALDPALGRQIDASTNRQAFIQYLMKERSLTFTNAAPAGPWQAFLMEQIMRAVQSGDLTTFVRGLQREPWLLGEACVGFQMGLIERATLRDRGAFIVALLDLEPAIVRRQPLPPSQAIEIAVTYAHTHLVPVLTRIWPLPDDLPHAAAMGNLSLVKDWFDESGVPALGDLAHHYPCNNPRARGHLRWNPPTAQQVLDVALAFAVINGHFDVADFLLAHGSDINTDWGSHEPASILHELVFHGNYESMRFLIDRGIDVTIKDYRWNSTAQGWARQAAKDEKMAQWLEEAAARRRGVSE